MTDNNVAEFPMDDIGRFQECNAVVVLVGIASGGHMNCLPLRLKHLR